jgi:hypothetical protein
MVTNRPQLILAYHGCDKAVRDAVVRGEHELESSRNEYDWLGPGIYFWEHSYDRALHFAKDRKTNPKGTTRIQEPSVLGAVIMLADCLDLLDSRYLSLVQRAHTNFVKSFSESTKIPRNIGGADKLLRHLDCAVIRHLHKMREERSLPPFDTVRSVFFEGKPLYPKAGFREKNHIQVCVINPECRRFYRRGRACHRLRHARHLPSDGLSCFYSHRMGICASADCEQCDIEDEYHGSFLYRFGGWWGGSAG